jgi:hypothetical protein
MSPSQGQGTQTCGGMDTNIMAMPQETAGQQENGMSTNTIR